MWRARRSQLPFVFLAAMLLPATALGWFGWQLLEQDRQLERQRLQDAMEAAADRATAALERELGAIERTLGAGRIDLPDARGADASVIRVSPNGSVTTLLGPPLPYAPAGKRHVETATNIWAEGERHEFGRRDNAAAAAAYRAHTLNPDVNISAEAFIRLARIFRKMGRVDEALDAYAAVARTRNATVLGDPADLMARWAAVDTLATVKGADAARGAAVLLDRDLRSGRWQLDEATAITYLEALRPWRTDLEPQGVLDGLRRAAAVSAAWRQWQSKAPTASLTPREVHLTAGTEFLSVRRELDGDLMIFMASASSLVRAWEHNWLSPGITVTLERPDISVPGTGAATVIRAASVRHAADTKLPWTIRVAATRPTSELAAATAVRRRTILIVVVIAAALMLGTGYLVVRAVNKELAVARQQSQFVAAVSHEFRSPLTSLAHLTALLKSDFQPSEQRRREYYDLMASETDRLRQFVETLLDFGRMQAGAVHYRLNPVAVNEFVSRVVHRFEQHAAAQSHPLAAQLSEQSFTINADEDALGRALWNLLENAAKYSPPDRLITVTVDRTDREVSIAVRDEGAGIPAAEQPFIFDQFYRGATATQSAIKGTGVGLAMVRHIVEGHHGRVKCDSRAGTGSTFTVSLPIAGDDDTQREKKAS